MVTTTTHHTTTITKLSHDGRGIGHINGKTILVQGALPGETVEIRFLKKHKQYAEAIAVKVSNPAKERVDSHCQHYQLCGGCSMQHMNHQAQITHKQDTLLEQLKHFGDATPEQTLTSIIDHPWQYRQKARLSVHYVSAKKKTVIGFRERSGRNVAELEHCPVLTASVGEQLPALTHVINQLSCQNKIPQIEVTVTGDITAIIIRHLVAFTDSDIDKLLAFGKQMNWRIYLQPKGLNSVHLVWPQNTSPLLTYQLPGELEMQFMPTDFTQVNPGINHKMIDQALSLLELKPSDTVLDLFCGVGNFTLPIAKRCKQVTGVEGMQIMIERATDNAALNKLTNVDLFTSDLSQEIWKTSRWAKKTYDKILLDPARSGAESIAKHIKQFKAERIVYVSCNPATLARDTKLICSQGYQLVSAGILDMFPQTSHVESMALFIKLK